MDDYRSINLDALRVHYPELAADFEARAASDRQSGRLTMEPSRLGPPTLVSRRNGKPVSLHSRYDPTAEAEKLTNNLGDMEGKILVVLGLGLGYHVRAALDVLPAEAPLAIVEADPDVFDMAVRYMDLRPIIQRPNLKLIVGRPAEEALQAIGRFQIAYSFSDPVILNHPSSVRLAPDYYGHIAGELASAGNSGLRQALLRPRLKSENLSVLLIDSGYYLVREIRKALESLGHRVLALPAPERNFGNGNLVRGIMEAAVSFKPDFLLTVNHLGFDTQGILTELLERMRLPCASWFVDSPSLILSANRGNVTPNASIFLWDEAYKSEVHGLGFPHVHYLPLGTDHTLFKPIPRGQSRLQHLARPISFVGDSMIGPMTRDWGRLNLGDEHLPRVEEAARAFMRSADQNPLSAMNSSGLLHQPAVRRLEPASLVDLEALVTWWATHFQRAAIMKKLEELAPLIVGDEGWKQVLGPGKSELHKPLDYYEELPHFYPVSDVNMNITSMQMKSGVNQRVFDVPACGAFLLTDYRSQLENLFDIGREAVCYHSPEEALDKARFFLTHERERMSVAERGRKRVLAGHTYQRRLEALIRHMIEDHAS